MPKGVPRVLIHNMAPNSCLPTVNTMMLQHCCYQRNVSGHHTKRSIMSSALNLLLSQMTDQPAPT